MRGFSKLGLRQFQRVSQKNWMRRRNLQDRYECIVIRSSIAGVVIESTIVCVG